LHRDLAEQTSAHSHKPHGCLFSAPANPEFVEMLSTYRRAVIDTLLA
jgi:hypothetical protein